MKLVGNEGKARRVEIASSDGKLDRIGVCLCEPIKMASQCGDERIIVSVIDELWFHALSSHS